MSRVALRRSARILLTVAALSCKESGGPASAPASIALLSTAAVSAEVGTTLAATPSFVVRDAAGRAVGGVAVNVTVGEGGGTLANAPARSGPGATSVGNWTLGTRAGRNTLVVAVAGVPALTIEATASPGPPSAIRVTGGDNQEAPAGDELPAEVRVQVTDRFGNGASQQPVRFEILAGGGTVTPATAVTDAHGVAGGIRWRLGAHGGAQTLRALLQPLAVDFSAQIQSAFNIDVRFIGVPPSAAVQASFRSAAERIRAAVVGDMEDVSVQGLDVFSCTGGQAAALSETIDDILIFASITNIDGVGRILARAGPCFLRNTSLQPLVGVMQFDAADVPALLNSARLESVVLHEMLHVVGIGSLWRVRNFVTGIGTTDPRYSGPIAFARCTAIGFGSSCVGGVPLENTGGSGTAEVHWRESVFDRELMTGFAESAGEMPLSLMTLGSLADYGFVINERSADPFQPGAAARIPGRDRGTPPPEWDEVLEPQFTVTSTGRVLPLRRDVRRP